MVRSILVTLNRQDKFKGDLNFVQQIGLMWIINHEMNEQIDLEKMRALSTGLAVNPSTSREYILSLLKEEEEETKTSEEWTTPESVRDIEEFLRTTT